MKTKTKINKKTLIAVGALAIVVMCAISSRFWLQLAIVEGYSMAPTYKSTQFVLVDKVNKNFQRGDVIAFRSGTAGLLIKRIAAAGGDSIEIRDGKVLVNETESTIYKDHTIDFSGIAKQTIQLDENELFVLGDNLSESKDSRYEAVGVIKQDDIIGKIVPQKNLN